MPGGSESLRSGSQGLNPGGWAVIAFYVLSGFLMERQYRKLCPRGGSRAFYFDRLLRIFPLYVTVLVLAGILVPRSFSTVVANLLLFPTNYFEFTGGTAMVGVAWSLACEAHFYLLVPFLARASTKALRWMAAGSVAVFIVSPFLLIRRSGPTPAFLGCCLRFSPVCSSSGAMSGFFAAGGSFSWFF